MRATHLRVMLVSLGSGVVGGLGASACDPFNEPSSMDFEPRPGVSEPAAAADGGETPPEVDSVAALASIADGGYRGAGFTHATLTPYPSTVATGSFVDEWVSSASYAEYSRVSPDAGDSGVVLPVGSTVVRAVVDSNDDVIKLTVMLKGPAGYNPALGDWWFAETDPWGTPLSDDAGTLIGRLAACYGCHVPRSGDDYLFGVPLDDRPQN
ncbi:MAG: hypothetical protein ABSE49_14715 [Polyangiaceae bacterium]